MAQALNQPCGRRGSPNRILKNLKDTHGNHSLGPGSGEARPVRVALADCWSRQHFSSARAYLIKGGALWGYTFHHNR